MSWGIYHHGTLDGTSLLSQVISAYTDSGVVFVNSAGNNGNVNFHIKKTFSDDVLKSKIDFYPNHSNSTYWTQSIHAWGEVGKSFSNGIVIMNDKDSLIAESTYYSTNSSNDYIDTFIVVNEDTIWFDISSDNSHPLNKKPQLLLRVKKTNSSEKKPRSSKKLTTEEAAHTRLVTKVRIHDFRFFFILKLILSFI
jgi:hypothetical protein